MVKTDVLCLNPRWLVQTRGDMRVDHFSAINASNIFRHFWSRSFIWNIISNSYLMYWWDKNILFEILKNYFTDNRRNFFDYWKQLFCYPFFDIILWFINSNFAFKCMNTLVHEMLVRFKMVLESLAIFWRLKWAT